MVRTTRAKKNKLSPKKENQVTFGDTCVISYEVFPASKKKVHERKFNVNSISGNKYTVTVNKIVDCTCPDCQHRRRRCKHIEFIMNNILHENYPRITYDNKTLDYLFKYLPGNIPHVCK